MIPNNFSRNMQLFFPGCNVVLIGWNTHLIFNNATLHQPTASSSYSSPTSMDATSRFQSSGIFKLILSIFLSLTVVRNHINIMIWVVYYLATYFCTFYNFLSFISTECLSYHKMTLCMVHLLPAII